MTLRDKLFYFGILTALVSCLLCAAFGPSWSPTACLFAFWGYLVWAEIVLHLRADRQRQKTSDLREGR